MRRISTVLLGLALLLAVSAEARAQASPVGLLNYQGVLRGGDDRPKDGSFDIVFGLYPSLTDPLSILVDDHTAAYGCAVTVTGGLFNTTIGSCHVVDGPGSGTYTSLDQVFRDYAAVYLQLTVNGEALTPRARIVPTAWAQNANSLDGIDSTGFSRPGHGHAGSEISGAVSNADMLDGRHASGFLDVTSTPQVKDGTLTLSAASLVDSVGLMSSGSRTGVQGLGATQGGVFADSNESGVALLGYGHIGVWGQGNEVGGFFKDVDGAAEAWLGYGATGVQGHGSSHGGVFVDVDGTGWARVGSGDAGISAYGADTGGYFEDTNSGGKAWLGHGAYGIEATGDEMGAAGNFLDPATGAQAVLADGDFGIQGSGTFAGGSFRPMSGSGLARVGLPARGVEGSGSGSGGHFWDTDGTGQATLGIADTGMEGRGNYAGGYFKDLDEGGEAWVGFSDYGISAEGAEMGAWLRAKAPGTGYAKIGFGDYGVYAEGNSAGGYFKDRDSTGYAHVGQGNRGIAAYGSEAGGFFKDSDGSGAASVGYGNSGINAEGNTQGGYFRDLDEGGQAWVGFSDYGISAEGAELGGWFRCTGHSGSAIVGHGEVGITAEGSESGGYFRNTAYSGWARLGHNHHGIVANGLYMGGYFTGPSGAWAEVANGTHKIEGNGTVSFVQNHPGRPDQVVMYAAPEGDEVAVYTRGTARLSGGEARVSLGDTFRLVANPDLGLTAYVTPVGEWADLYVASKSTEELVVRAPEGSPDVTFDYVVWGLRLGFEDLAIVQPRTKDASPPPVSAFEALYGGQAGLRAHSARERFTGMRRALGEGEPDLSRSRALMAALEEQRAAARQAEELERQAAPPAPSPGWPVPPAPTGAEPPEEESETEVAVPAGNLFPVTGPVEPGDVLALDPAMPGAFRRAESAADPLVVGIAAGAPVEVEGVFQVALVETNVATVRADAAPGAIVPGDLLVSSPLPGHAMRSAAPAPGTVLGKALEPLEAGTGTIRILVIPR